MKLLRHVPLLVLFVITSLSAGAEDRHPLAASRSVTPMPSQAGGTLVWSDEFTGEKLDYSKWGIEQNALGGGNQELQIYTERPENVRVEEGYLVLEARHDNAALYGTSREYSSGRVRTKHRGDWKFGRIEVRAKLPSGQGIWPAIWMLPTDESYGTWAASGEIDIMEMRGQEPNKVLGTLHYGGKWPNNTHSGSDHTLATGSFADDFHVFAIEWNAKEIKWFVDDIHYQTQSKWHSESAAFPAPFDQRFHLLLNVAVGGGFLGPPDETTHFPQKMLVDYVRVYQQD
ncbi:MAG: glycoside hydrolase family 16 protein [Planctomycetota bacterium]